MNRPVMPPSREVREDGGFPWLPVGFAVVMVALALTYTAYAYSQCDGTLVRGLIGFECIR